MVTRPGELTPRGRDQPTRRLRTLRCGWHPPVLRCQICPSPNLVFVFFPGRAKRRGPNRREGRGRPVWRKRPRARSLIWELCEEARAAAYMEAPRRVPSRERGGTSRPGLSLRCARQQRSRRGAFGQTTLVPADLSKAEERANSEDASGVAGHVLLRLVDRSRTNDLFQFDEDLVCGAHSSLPRISCFCLSPRRMPRHLMEHGPFCRPAIQRRREPGDTRGRRYREARSSGRAISVKGAEAIADIGGSS